MLDFQAEIKAFEAALPGLLVNHGGEFAVIHGSKVDPRTFASYEEALAWAYEQFGLDPFFVKQIAEKSHAAHFMRGFSK